MPSVFNGYPDKLSTKELKATVADYQKAIVDSKGNINTILQFSPLIQLGLEEIRIRSSRLSAILTSIIAITSLVASIFAINLSEKAMKSSKAWEERQIKSLNEINKSNSTGAIAAIAKINPKLENLQITTNDMKEELKNIKVILDDNLKKIGKSFNNATMIKKPTSK